MADFQLYVDSTAGGAAAPAPGNSQQAVVKGNQARAAGRRGLKDRSIFDNAQTKGRPAPQQHGDAKQPNQIAKVKDVPAAVPVAQLRAFNIYDDKENGAKKGQAKAAPKPAEKQPQRVLRQKAEERRQVEDVDDPAVPMSIEKSICEAMSVEKQGKTTQETQEDGADRVPIDGTLDMVVYQASIIEYMKQRELLQRPKPGYMRKQPDISYNMRTILVDWMVEVGEEYRLHTQTIHLAVQYVDRFLSYMSVVRAKLQLLGTAALFLASKYEEIYPPDVGEFVYITDDTYTKQQVIRMEKLILRVLEFEVCQPTSFAFVTAFAVVGNMRNTTMHLALFICELVLLDAELTIETVPSRLAAAAVVVARHLQHLDGTIGELEPITGYALAELRPICERLIDVHREARTQQQQGIVEKYKEDKYGEVSLLPARDEPIQYE